MRTISQAYVGFICPFDLALMAGAKAILFLKFWMVKITGHLYQLWIHSSDSFAVIAQVFIYSQHQLIQHFLLQPASINPALIFSYNQHPSINQALVYVHEHRSFKHKSIYFLVNGLMGFLVKR